MVSKIGFLGLFLGLAMIFDQTSAGGFRNFLTPKDEETRKFAVEKSELKDVKLNLAWQKKHFKHFTIFLQFRLFSDTLNKTE